MRRLLQMARSWLAAPRGPEILAARPTDDAGPAAIDFALSDPPTADRRVLVFADGQGATQHISFAAPLAKSRERGETALFLVTEAALDRLDYRNAPQALAAVWRSHRPSHVILSRIATRHVGAIVAQCRSASTPVIAHLDDDLFGVPEDLGAGKVARHNDPARLARLTIACRRADLIYASTAALADVLRARFPDKRIAAGEIYAAAEPPFAPYRPRTPLTFGYMGTAGHGNDLADLAEQIGAVLDARPEMRFETFGTIRPPESLARFGARVASHGRAPDYESFSRQLRELGWFAGLAPLRDTPFNRCKADTKFVEYAQAGIPAIVSHPTVYARPLTAAAALGPMENGGWGAAVLRLADDEEAGRAVVTRAQRLLSEVYSIAALELQVLRVMQSTLEKDPTSAAPATLDSRRAAQS